MRHFFLSYEIDIDADTVEEAVRQATEYARNQNIAATWSFTSVEGSGGEVMPELIGFATIAPNGQVEVSITEGSEDKGEE
jgi:hypothetical protein